MIQRLSLLAVAVLLLQAVPPAAGKGHVAFPKNGSWVGTGDHAAYSIRVERRRVVAVYVDATPTVQSAQGGGACGHQYYGFTGSWLIHDNFSTTKGFNVTEPGGYGFAMAGTFASRKRLTGTLSLEGDPGVHASSRARSRSPRTSTRPD